jgi:D-glycero-D-manno-heptose 1,7-bisphosphate phosphatase
VSATLKPVVFLDRDGVINRTYVRKGTTHPPAHLGELQILPGVPEALDRLQQAGFVLVVVTNQPDVARGEQTQERVEAIHKHLCKNFPLLGVMACYHDDGDACHCRKPRPGMLYQAIQRWKLDVQRGFLVGDRWSDVVAGQTAGCRTVLIETPFSRSDRCHPDHRAGDLSGAVDWILGQCPGGQA